MRTIRDVALKDPGLRLVDFNARIEDGRIPETHATPARPQSNSRSSRATVHRSIWPPEGEANPDSPAAVADHCPPASARWLLRPDFTSRGADGLPQIRRRDPP